MILHQLSHRWVSADFSGYFFESMVEMDGRRTPVCMAVLQGTGVDAGDRGSWSCVTFRTPFELQLQVRVRFRVRADHCHGEG